VDKSGLLDVLPVDIHDISAFAHIGDSQTERQLAVAHGRKLAICLVDAVDKTRRHLKTMRFRNLTLPPFNSQLHQILQHEHPVKVCVNGQIIAVCTLDDTPHFIQNKNYPRRGRLIVFQKKTLSGTF
jgi:hypothetical protein